MVNILYKIRYYLLAVVATACVLLWPGARAATAVDNSLATWFLKDDPALRAYADFRTRFGNDEVVILVVHDPQTLLQPAYFTRFRALTRQLEALPTVQSVTGPGNARVPGRDLTGASARPLLGPGTGAAQVRAALHDRPTLGGQLFSADYRSARFLVELRNLPDFDNRRAEVLAQVQRVVDAHFSPAQAYLGGVGIVYAGLNALSQHDFGLFLGLGYLLMFGVFLGLYRNLRLLLYTLGIVALSTYLTFGIYGALGYRLNLMTVLLPIVIILLGIMDSMHVINERNLLARPGSPALADTLQTLRNVFYPCLSTMLTTVAGFLALLTSPMAILQTFGVFAALGIFFCLLFTYLLGVLLLPHTRPAPRATAAASVWVGQFYQFLLARQRLFTALSLLLIAAFAVGTTRLRTDTYTLGYLPADHRVVRDHQAIEATWGPYMPLELLVRPRPGHTLHDTAVVQAAAAFTDSVQTLTGVGRVFGFQSLYQGGLEAQAKGKARRLLASQGALNAVHRQLLTPEYAPLARQFVHEPSGTGRITISGTMLSARQLTAKMDSVLGMARATLGPVATVQPAGYQPMYSGIVRYVTASQTNSLLWSFLLVFALTWAFIRDFRLAVLTVLPNLFPVLVLLGLMGWLGIPLDTATASIAAIVLSFCTDDSIHFIYAYRQRRRAGLSPAEARLTTLTHIGPTIVLTSVILFFGYSSMLLASLKTVELFGALTALAIIGALYGELVIFPLVLERFDREPGAKPKPVAGGR
ncbi:efflux RND transporter permease subunit [Hymenobacter algoricola]|uniref:MMPL family transporter n=1 Tax=Hymenobacter algoricola TaxID=486267 RepID=A0ABP7MZN3_9BACT